MTRGSRSGGVRAAVALALVGVVNGAWGQGGGSGAGAAVVPQAGAGEEVVEAPEARAVEARIDAAPGRPLVVPVTLDPPGLPHADAPPVSVALSESGPVTSELVWISPRRTERDEEDAIARWLDRPEEWTAVETWAMEGRFPGPPGFWALVIHLPRGCAGQRLMISGREAPVQWLEPLPPAPDPGAEAQFRPERPGLRAMLAPARRDPLNRWRTRLLLERLSAPRGTVFDRYDERMATHALEALAEQSEWRWRVALDRLGKADPFLAADLLNRLTTVIDFGEGRLAPAWPTDEVALAALRTDLLDPRAAPETVRRRAAAFIALVSPATAWVIDDAGSVDAETGATMAIFGVAERAGRGITARAAWSGESAAVEVAPLSVRRLAAVSERRPSDAPLQGASAVIELGARRVSVEALPLAAPVRPPGLRIGPGFQAWTLDSWTEGRARPAAPEQSFSILLHRRGDLVGSGAGAWQFYIECPVARGGEGDGGARRAGFLRLWFGPTARPVAALRLGEDGTLVEEVSGAAAALVHFERREDRIVAIVALPEGAVERDGVLRIAVERVDAEGRRATWPRPVLPWESAIGRAALDLASWRALTPGAAEPVR